jgi:hypothetical protein
MFSRTAEHGETGTTEKNSKQFQALSLERERKLKTHHKVSQVALVTDWQI